jgi:hemolysin activation/secretion protein
MPFLLFSSGLLPAALSTPIHQIDRVQPRDSDWAIAQATSDDEDVSDPCQIFPNVSEENTLLITAPPIQSIELEENTVFTVEEVETFTQSFIGLPASHETLEQLQQCVTQQYLNRGYLSSQAGTPENQDGVIIVPAFEGYLYGVYVNDDPTIEENEELRIDEDYIRDRILRGNLDEEPLNANRLEDRLRVLRRDPLFENVEASLRATELSNSEDSTSENSDIETPTSEPSPTYSDTTAARTDLYVRVTEAPPIELDVSADNYSPSSVGSERLNAHLTYYNVTGAGDIFSLAASHTVQGGADVIGAVYQIPVNSMNGTLQLSATFDRNHILTSPFDELGIRGESELYAIQFRQPLVLTYREEFALSFELSVKDGQTFFFNDIPTPFGIGPDEQGNSRTSVLRFSQDYIHRDIQGAWSMRSQFNLGTDWFDATTNSPPIPDSQFISWFGQVQRAQQLGQNHLLLIQGEIQLTPNTLLPAEQFVIGGGESIRGYRQNARSGDNGFRFAIEDRITLTRSSAGAPELLLTPFLEMGDVWNHPNNPNSLPEQNFLISAGLGLALTLQSGFYAQLNYAVPFVDLSDRGNNLQDDGITFQIGINRRF